MQRAYRQGTRALSAVLVAVGLTMAVSAVVAGGGPLSLGVMLGLVFAAAGAARLVLFRDAGG